MHQTRKLPPLPKPTLDQSQALQIKRVRPENPLLPTALNRPMSHRDEGHELVGKRPSSRKDRPISSVSVKSGRSRTSLSGSMRDVGKEKGVLTGEGGACLSMPKVSARSWVLFEMKQGKCLFGRQQFRRREIASLTKILNLVTILSIVDTLQLQPSQVRARASQRASHVNGTTAELREGHLYSMEDLYYGMMLPSGNDAATMIAQMGACLLKTVGSPSEAKRLQDADVLTEAISKEGSSVVGTYLREMNRVGREIGMLNTNVANPHGLSNSASFSTASDLAKLCIFAMKNPLFRKIVNTKKHDYTLHLPSGPAGEAETDKENLDPNLSEVGEEPEKGGRGLWENTNKMLGVGWSGIKTGITPNAGPCLAASCLRTVGGRQLEFLVVLLRSESMQARWGEAEGLVEWAVKEGLRV